MNIEKTSKGLYLDGVWQEGTGAGFASHDPAYGHVIWQGKEATPDQVAEAFGAAQRAFPAWSRLSYEDRRAIVLTYKALAEERVEDMARLIASETGKPLWETRTEARGLAAKVDISIKAYEERTGAHESTAPFGRMSLRHKPHGVLAVLGPYNFPAHLPNGHIVPALLAGDTLVFKPSEITPAVGEALVQLWHDAGLPAGVLNLLQGARGPGAAMLERPELDGVLFTGSAETGAFIHKTFGGRPEILLALEMGGFNPLLVWDAGDDVGALASLILQSAFITTGQRCSCARRLIVKEGEGTERLITTLLEKMDGLVIGAWDEEPQPFMGPLVSEKAADQVLQAQDALITQGGQALRSARRLDRGPAFLSPGLVDVTGLQTPDRETFGPLLQLRRVEDFDAALTEANNTRFGLSAGLISENSELWERFKTDIRAGIVNFNRPTTGAAGSMPFGGPGLSGNHRPSAYYAADYCAYPVASQEADRPEPVHVPGYPD